MLLFSTILEINSRMNRQGFTDLINDWNRTIYYEENRIPDLNWKGGSGFRFGSDELWLAAEEYSKASTVAVRYEKREKDGIIWDTDYVMNFRNMKLAIRLDRSYSEDAIPKGKDFSAPYFIELLIDRGYLKKDDDLPILHEPIYIEDDMIPLLSSVIKGNKQYKYPIVYVSKNNNNEDPLDVGRLARKLKGVAHVLVQKDLSQNKAIQNACEGKNEYKGSVGIYYPNRTFEHKKLVYRRAEGPDPYLLELAVQAVSQYCNSRMIDTLFTWQGVNNALLLDRITTQSNTLASIEEAKRRSEDKANELQGRIDDETRKLRDEIRKEVLSEAEQLIDIADEENRELKKQIEELTKKNEALEKENFGLSNKVRSLDSVPALVYGEEHDFFEGEIKDFILSTLNEAVRNLPSEGCRRRDVLEDIIRNNDYTDILSQRKEYIMNLLKTYDGMTPKLRQELESYGFEVKDGGKHYQLFYKGDQRYVKTMSKTPSDWRTGKISRAEIVDMAY